MKALLLKTIAALMLVLGAHTAQATHMTGGAITYECIAPNQYKVKITLFRDCTGLPFQPITDLYAYNGCDETAHLYLTPLPGTGAPVPTECDNRVTTCDYGIIYGVQKYESEGIFNIPANTPSNCQTWRISWNTCCRNNSTTIPMGNGFHIETILFNHTPTNPTFCNSSPQINIPYLPTFCVNDPIFFDWGITEADGDSMVFVLDSALDISGVPVLYAAGLNPIQPVFTTTPIVVNPTDGNISFETNQRQLGVIALKIKEYRNGLLISEVLFDMQILIGSGEFCDNKRPTYTADTLNVPCNTTMLNLRYDKKINCGTVAADGSDFRIFKAQNGQGMSINSTVPAYCDSLNYTDTLKIMLYDTLAENGIYYLYTKKGTDGNTLSTNCPKYQSEMDTLVINVTGCAPIVANASNLFFVKTNTIQTIKQAQPLVLNAAPPLQLTLINAMGQQVYYNANYQNNFVGDNLPTGIYFYHIKNEKMYGKGAIKILK
jgi:hypothetical protein